VGRLEPGRRLLRRQVRAGHMEKLQTQRRGHWGGLFYMAWSCGWRDNGQKPTPEEIEARRRQAAERTAKEKAKERSRHEAAAASAAEILAAATGDPAAHPYAIKKRVPFGPQVRRGLWPQRGWNALLVPLYDGEGCLSAVEAINVDGAKDFLEGGRISGCFYPFGNVRGAARVFLGEGLASVAACVAAESSPAVAALSAPNLKAAALAVRELAPGAEIIILADNDVKPNGNPGLEAADAAARAVGGLVAVPELDGRKCDFWDLWHERGVEAVREAIAGAKAPESEAEDMDATVRRLAALPPLEYDRCRESEAKRLEVRLSTLDSEVGKLRPSTDDATQGSAVLFPDIEPWPDPVNGAELLTDLTDTARDYVVLPKHTDTAIALWTLGTHVIDSLDVAPVPAISSPVIMWQNHRAGLARAACAAPAALFQHQPVGGVSGR
jgi:phage/plasmid primase-like uncharacterized protein